MGTKEPTKERLKEKIHFSEWKTPASEETKGVISFEVGWQQELEFRERIKMRSLFVGSRLVRATTQKLPPNTNIDEGKMKAAFPSPPLEKQASSLPSQPNTGAEFRNRFMPPHQLQRVSTERLQLCQPSPHHLRSYQPLFLKRPLPPIPEEQDQDSNLGQHSSKKPMLQSPKEREISVEEISLQRYSMKRALMDHMQSSSSPTIPVPLWCNICKMPCTGKFNYEQHCQAKKHKARWKDVFGNIKEIEKKKHNSLWCNECGIPCLGKLALAQHASWKKHVFHLIELKGLNVTKFSETKREQV